MAATCRVQLGVYDSPCPSQRLSPYENKIGGYPDFFTTSVLSSPPTCKCCSGSLVLLAQVYCPHDSSPYHRLLHVFCCCRPACWSKSESWLVLRSQLKDPSCEENCSEKDTRPLVAVHSAKPELMLTAAKEWCEDVDDWGDDGVNEVRWDSQTTDVSPRAAAAAVHVERTQIIEDLMKTLTVEETSTSTSSVEVEETLSLYKGPYYPAGYISVVEEQAVSTFEADELLKKYKYDHPNLDDNSTVCGQEVRRKKTGHGNSGQREKGRRHGDGASNGGEVYEKGVAKHGDKTFQKFHKHLSKCPQQILRYSWKGRPLLFTDHPSHLPPKESALACKQCGAACVYEIQLMPPLIYVLHQSRVQAAGVLQDTSSSLPEERTVEFGTVLIYSCSVSCWEEGSTTNTAPFREEIVLVQPDLDTIDRIIEESKSKR